MTITPIRPQTHTLTTREVAARAGLARNTVQDHIRRGWLKATLNTEGIVSFFTITEDDFQEYMELRRTQVRSSPANLAAARIENTDFLLSWGCGWAEVLTRVGFPSPEAAERFFQRHGRPDLAGMFAVCTRLESGAA